MYTHNILDIGYYYCPCFIEILWRLRQVYDEPRSHKQQVSEPRYKGQFLPSCQNPAGHPILSESGRTRKSKWKKNWRNLNRQKKKKKLTDLEGYFLLFLGKTMPPATSHFFGHFWTSHKSISSAKLLVRCIINQVTSIYGAHNMGLAAGVTAGCCFTAHWEKG